MRNTWHRVVLVALTALVAPSQAHAICIISYFLGTATPLASSRWLFEYSVGNGCSLGGQQLMTDFYVPYFADAGIADITVPAPDVTTTTSTITWTATILPDNLFGLPGAGVIDFHVTATPLLEPIPGQPEPGVGYYFASGFSYTSNYGALEAPAAIQQTLSHGGAYDQTVLTIFDPPIPDSPLAHAALTATPEPGTVSLTGIGVFLMVCAARARSGRIRLNRTCRVR